MSIRWRRCSAWAHRLAGPPTRHLAAHPEPHLLATRKTALDTEPVAYSFLTRPLRRHDVTLGRTRRDRIMQEALATGGADPQHLTVVVSTPVAFNVAASGHGDRVRFYPGDFFADDLPTADVLVMGHILHNWNLDEKRLLLKKAYDALPKGGVLIVYDALIDDDRRENAYGLLLSLAMLIETEGGFDYTGAECRQWLHDAGFRETSVRPLNGPDSMAVGIK